jgi:hypothetical protein
MSTVQIEMKRSFFQSRLNALKLDPSNEIIITEVRNAAADFTSKVRDYQLAGNEYTNNSKVSNEIKSYIKSIFEAGIQKNSDFNYDVFGGLAWISNGKLNLIPSPAEQSLLSFKEHYGELVGKLVPISSIITWGRTPCRQITDLTIDVSDDVYFEIEFSPSTSKIPNDLSRVMIALGGDIENILSGESQHPLIVVDSISNQDEVRNTILVDSGDELTTPISKIYRHESISRNILRVGIGYKESTNEVTIFVRDGNSHVNSKTYPLDVLKLSFVILSPVNDTDSITKAGHLIIRHEIDSFKVLGNKVVPDDYFPLSDIV